jgi:hypothetical protein
MEQREMAILSLEPITLGMRLARYPYFCIGINMLRIIFQAPPERPNLLGTLVAFVNYPPARRACRTPWGTRLDNHVRIRRIS